MKTLESNTKIHKDKGRKVLKKEPFCFIRWVLIVEFIILTIMFSFGAIFKLIPDVTKYKIKYSIQSLFNNEIKKEKNDLIFNLEAVNKNAQLSDNNKSFIIDNLIPEIEENKEYIDLKIVRNRLENLKIETNNDAKMISLGAVAKYNSVFNIINFYGLNKDVDFKDVDKTIYFHELNHVLSIGNMNSAMSKVNLNESNIFSELINELFSREYYSKEKSLGYEEQMKYIYVLAEILPEDVLRKYKFNNNEVLLVNGLLEIDNNISKAYELIDLIDNVQDKENQDSKNYKQIHDLLEYFYEKKTGKKLITNMNILAYLYESEVIQNEEKELFENYVGINNLVKNIEIIAKGYFSSEYKKENQNIMIKINNDYFKILK